MAFVWLFHHLWRTLVSLEWNYEFSFHIFPSFFSLHVFFWKVNALSALHSTNQREIAPERMKFLLFKSVLQYKIIKKWYPVVLNGVQEIV